MTGPYGGPKLVGMFTAETSSTRAAGRVLALGAAATFVGGVVVQAAVQPGTNVPDERWSYPWTADALTRISLVWALLHVLVFTGILGFARSGLAGDGRAGRIGPRVALAGTAMLFAGELASIPVRHQQLSDSGATAVGVLFGVASAVVTVGLVAAGAGALKARRLRGHARFAPIVAGAGAAVVTVIGTTKALPTGVALYGLGLLVLGVCMMRAGAPSTGAARGLVVREQIS